MELCIIGNKSDMIDKKEVSATAGIASLPSLDDV